MIDILLNIDEKQYLEGIFDMHLILSAIAKVCLFVSNITEKFITDFEEFF